MENKDMKAVIIKIDHKRRKLLRLMCIQQEKTMQDYIVELIAEDLRKKGVNW